MLRDDVNEIVLRDNTGNGIIAKQMCDRWHITQWDGWSGFKGPSMYSLKIDNHAIAGFIDNLLNEIFNTKELKKITHNGISYNLLDKK